MSHFALDARKFRVAAIVFGALLIATAAGAKKHQKCQEDECAMRPEHFKLYSNVKRALDQDFDIRGKDLVALIRSVEILQRRFAANQDRLSSRPNGTELVLGLLTDAKLLNAMSVFASDEGRQLVNLYKTSINGQHQNLACSRWRVGEIEFASKRLERSEKLARVFTNVHKNFLERSARKCLKSSCGSLDDNMNRLDSVLRRPSKRRGFLARDDALVGSLDSSTSANNNNNRLPEDQASNAIEEAQLIAQLSDEPASEFQREETELCRFFKRASANATSCQASGNELSEIRFLEPVRLANATARANLTEYLETYRAGSQKRPTGDDKPGVMSLKQARKLILAQCHAIMPTLEYHMFGLRWFQRQGLIAPDQLRSRTFWCPSLSYWIEIERLCGELESSHSDRINGDENNSNNNNTAETFAY